MRSVYILNHHNPPTINGKISNLREEDMIGVTINETEDKIYIDFEYMGLPSC